MSFDNLNFSLKQRQKFAKLDLVMKPIFVSGLDKRTVILCSKQRSSQCLPVAAAARPTLHQHPHYWDLGPSTAVRAENTYLRSALHSNV